MHATTWVVRAPAVVGVAVVGAAVVMALAPAVAWAGHQPSFAQESVEADTTATLGLQVPEAGPEHNPEQTADHYTVQVDVTVPDAFEMSGVAHRTAGTAHAAVRSCATAAETV